MGQYYHLNQSHPITTATMTQPPNQAHDPEPPVPSPLDQRAGRWSIYTAYSSQWVGTFPDKNTAILFLADVRFPYPTADTSLRYQVLDDPEDIIPKEVADRNEEAWEVCFSIGWVGSFATQPIAMSFIALMAEYLDVSRSAFFLKKIQ